MFKDGSRECVFVVNVKSPHFSEITEVYTESSMSGSKAW